MKINTNTNPYEPPSARPDSSLSDDAGPFTEIRHQAHVALVTSLWVLVLPALCNVVCFCNPPQKVTRPLPQHLMVANGIGFVAVVFVIRFAGLRLLESLVVVLHAAFASRSRRSEWQRHLYEILRRMPGFAVAGACLWFVWVSAIYYFRLDFFVVSIPVGIAAHLLAAGLYIPLAYRWYRLERR
ncbi:MAG: hypothetical protein KDA96_17625 [Planctomycetaceae bacterium]|nr:hypothetical protein [Planctomycetaceae bacterium]